MRQSSDFRKHSLAFVKGREHQMAGRLRSEANCVRGKEGEGPAGRGTSVRPESKGGNVGATVSIQRQRYASIAIFKLPRTSLKAS